MVQQFNEMASKAQRERSERGGCIKTCKHKVLFNEGGAGKQRNLSVIDGPR